MKKKILIILGVIVLSRQGLDIILCKIKIHRVSE